MSETEQAMASFLHVFSKYAGAEGDKTKLSKAELKVLLQTELGGLLGKVDNQAKLDQIFKTLDANSDGQVDFEEFGCLIMSIAAMCHDCLCRK